MDKSVKTVVARAGGGCIQGVMASWVLGFFLGDEIR